MSRYRITVSYTGWREIIVEADGIEAAQTMAVVQDPSETEIGDEGTDEYVVERVEIDRGDNNWADAQ